MDLRQRPRRESEWLAHEDESLLHEDESLLIVKDAIWKSMRAKHTAASENPHVFGSSSRQTSAARREAG
jgi:hypothetical protein